MSEIRPEGSKYIDKMRKMLGDGFTGQKRKEKKEMGKDDFIKLLSTQLQNQDPTSPLKNEQMAAQLAQFSSLEQMVNMNDKLEKMVGANDPNNSILASQMIGKEVVTDSSRFDFIKGKPTDISFHLPGSTTEGTLMIYDSKGQAIREIELGVRDKGEHSVRWDGRDDKGSELGTGTYRYVIDAKDKEGNKVAVDTEIKGLVTGVSFAAGNPTIFVKDKKVPLTAVSQISMPGTESKAGNNVVNPASENEKGSKNSLQKNVSEEKLNEVDAPVSQSSVLEKLLRKDDNAIDVADAEMSGVNLWNPNIE